MRCGPIAVSLLLHAAVIGGVCAFARTRPESHLVVTWRASEASQASRLLLEAPSPEVEVPEQPPTPAIEPETAAAPLPETAVVTPAPMQFAPQPVREVVTAIAAAPPTPQWLRRVQPLPAAAPPPAPASDYVAAVADSDNVDPVYPLESRRRRAQGSVQLEVEIDERGAVSAVHVLRSSGHLLLDRAAVAAVQQWHFEPARRGNEAVPSRLVQSVVFQLRSAG